jgi:anti-sigma factor RsiW
MNDAVHYDEVLQDLIDGRLPADQEPHVRAHLSSCERCRAVLDSLEAGRRAAVVLRQGIDLPPGLAAGIGAALDDEDRRPQPSHVAVGPRRTPGPASWRIAAAAVVVLAGVLAAWFWTRPVGLVDQAVRDFEAVISGELPLEIRSADPEQLEAHLAARSTTRVRVIDLGMMGFTLEGARRHTLASRPSALYAYRGRGDERIVCQMFPGDEGDLPATSDIREHGGFRFHVLRRGDITLVFWVEGDLVCVLVSRIPPDELAKLAFAKAMRPA